MTTFGEYMSQVLKVAKPANLPYLVTPKPTRVVESRLTSSLQRRRRFNDVVATIFRRIKSFISIQSLILRKKFFSSELRQKKFDSKFATVQKTGIIFVEKEWRPKVLFVFFSKSKPNSRDIKCSNFGSNQQWMPILNSCM